MKRLFDHDPLSGLTEWFHYDDATDKITIETVDDVEPVLDANKRSYNEGRKSTDFRRIATIPPVVQLLWMEKYGVDLTNKDHLPAVKRLLNDPEWRYLRTSPGVI